MLEGRARLGTGRAWRARVSRCRAGRSRCGRGFAPRTRCARRLGTCSVALGGASTQPNTRACLVDGALRGVVESVHVRGPVAQGTLSSGARATTNAAPHTPATAARSRRSRSPPSTRSVRGVACFHGVWEIQRPPGLTLLLGSEVISGKDSIFGFVQNLRPFFVPVFAHRPTQYNAPANCPCTRIPRARKVRMHTNAACPQRAAHTRRA